MPSLMNTVTDASSKVKNAFIEMSLRESRFASPFQSVKVAQVCNAEVRICPVWISCHTNLLHYELAADII